MFSGNSKAKTAAVNPVNELEPNDKTDNLV